MRILAGGLWFTNNSQSQGNGVLGPWLQTSERMFKVSLHTCYCVETKVKKTKKNKKQHQQKIGRGFPMGS